MTPTMNRSMLLLHLGALVLADTEIPCDATDTTCHVRPGEARMLLQQDAKGFATVKQHFSVKAAPKTETKGAKADFLTPQELMTCSSEPIFTTKCMTKEDYDAILEEIEFILEAELDLACAGADCQHADWAGCVLRMAGHDFMDHEASAGTGGSDACTDMNEGDNAGLAACLSEGEFGFSLNSIYPKFCTKISLADFVVIAAQAVMSHLAPAGTPGKTLSDGLKNSFRFGRTTLTGDACKADTHWHGRHLLPNPAKGCADVDRVFVSNMGLSWKEATALMGVHSLGRASPLNSGYVGYWDTPEHSRTFNNHYFVNMLAASWCPELNVNGCEPGGDCTPKNQWKRCDTGTDKFKHREMMLNSDMCLAYTDAKGGSLIAGEEDSSCCAWVHTKVHGFSMEDVIKNNNNSFCNVQCGETFEWQGMPMEMNCLDFSNGFEELVACCPFGDKPEFPDCMTPGLGNFPGLVKAPGIDFVREFAADELVWIDTFLIAWVKATENGFADSLKPFADSCESKPQGECIKFCRNSKKSWEEKCTRKICKECAQCQ